MKATKKGVLRRVKKTKGALDKTIKVKGQTLDKEMHLAFKRATRGKHNTLISQNDAKQIFEAARPAGNSGRSSYDKVEKRTMAFIRKNGKFTKAADKKLRGLVGKAAGAQGKRTKAKKAMKK